jgi:hypothetical protein
MGSVAKLVNAADCKSASWQDCRFNSDRSHFLLNHKLLDGEIIKQAERFNFFDDL